MPKIVFIVPPNYYVICQDANPPLHLEPFFNYGDFEIVHLYRGDDFAIIPQADIYGISAYTEDYHAACAVAKFLKQRDATATIMLGGSHVDAVWQNNEISSIFDVVVINNGDDLIQYLVAGGNIKGDRQIWWRRIKPPSIQWNKRSLKFFIKYNPNYHRGADKSYSVRTSYGCYSNCAFCAHEKWRHIRVGFREVQDIDRQLQDLADAGVTNIRIIDELVTYHPYFKDILKLLSNFKWVAQDRINHLTPNVCKLLKNSGCTKVQTGIESFDAAIRKKLNKGISDKTLYDGIQAAKDAELPLNAFIMLGLPGETHSTIKKTRDVGLELIGRDLLRPDIFCPYPGTDVYANANGYGIKILTDDYRYYSTFPFQNVNGQLVSIPKHVTNIDEWEQLLRETLYDMVPDGTREALDNPITDWYID